MLLFRVVRFLGFEITGFGITGFDITGFGSAYFYYALVYFGFFLPAEVLVFDDVGALAVNVFRFSYSICLSY